MTNTSIEYKRDLETLHASSGNINAELQKGFTFLRNDVQELTSRLDVFQVQFKQATQSDLADERDARIKSTSLPLPPNSGSILRSNNPSTHGPAFILHSRRRVLEVVSV